MTHDQILDAFLRRRKTLKLNLETAEAIPDDWNDGRSSLAREELAWIESMIRRMSNRGGN